MKKLIIAITFLVSSFAYAQVAEWSEPIQIAVDSGYVKPKFCFDNRGWIHVVWTHEVEEWQHNDIYYKKSIDFGDTWSSSQEISLNNYKLVYLEPWIASDNNNNLHVTFFENKGENPIRILYTSCDNEGQWQTKIDTLANATPGKYPMYSKVVVDAKGNIMVVWYTSMPDCKTYYRIKDKNTDLWGEVFCPFSQRSNIADIVVTGDTIYGTGGYKDSDMQYDNASYFTFSHGTWQTPVVLSNNHYEGQGYSIALNKIKSPSIIYRERFDTPIDSFPKDHAYFYTNIDDNDKDTLSFLPQLQGFVYTDIIYDQYNQAHVVQNEPINGKDKLMHYQKTSSGWVGEQLDINYNHAPFSGINLQAYGEDIYLVYVDWEKIYDTWEGAILLRKYTPQPEGIADNAEVNALGTFKVYPNPVQGACHLDYQLANTAQVDIAVYDMQGRQVSTIYQGQQAAGAQQLSWDGGSLSPGVYIVRLQVGKYVVNRKITVK